MMNSSIRVGIGYDVHPLVNSKKLVLGGVEIPFEKGLEGWSDADVLTHGIIEALLGAAAMGDIGSHFPPGDPLYKGVSSLVLLKRVREILSKAGWQIVNIDSTVVAEKPKLRDYIGTIRQMLSQVLDLDVGLVSVKASTNNGLGFIGHIEGVACYAVALIERNTTDC